MSPINQVQQNKNELVFNQHKTEKNHAIKVAELTELSAKAELRKDEFILSEAASALSAARRIS
jgi:hypothetical protein